MNIKIELISESDLADESFNIVIDGLKPREIYRVEMFLSDYYCINAPMLLAHDVLWKSTATFVSDKNGIIDISQTPSCSGSYEDIATMGLFAGRKIVSCFNIHAFAEFLSDTTPYFVNDKAIHNKSSPFKK